MNHKSTKKHRQWVTTVCALGILLMAFNTNAGKVQSIDTKIKRVALFKNGLGYFTSSATLPKGATTVKLQKLPIPSHGTFWIGYPQNVKIDALFSSMETISKTESANNIIKLLQANAGRKVTIHSSSEDMPAIKGIISKVIPEQKTVKPLSPYRMNIRSSRYRNTQSPTMAIIKTETGTVVINADLIVRVDFEESNISTSISTVSRRPNIRIELQQPADGGEIGISYLARGITWAPSYMIDISDPKTAKLSAKAIVINEVADMHNVQIDLVTGFPNIRFGEINSPVAMSQNLGGFLQALSRGRSESSRRRGVMTQQSITSNFAIQEDNSNYDSPVPEYSTAQQGTVSEDLFLYPIKKITIIQGETAYIPLFTAKIPYSHIYIWKIADMLNKHEQYQHGRRQNEQPSAEEIWHSCRLTNNMTMPWTTAPAEFIKDGQFTGQDICYYTAPGAKTTIRLNRALNIQAEETEIELERKRNAVRFHGYNYDLVKIKGTLKLHNRLDKRANMEVTKNLSGKVLTMAPQAKDIPTAKGLRRVNQRHILVWKFEMQSGKKQTLTYTYEVYVRN
jgi:hypothetical protein